MPEPMRLSLLVALLLLSSHEATGQSDPGARMERLADGVYAIVHADATHDWPSGVTDWPQGNSGVIVGSRCVLVVDATYYPGRAAADIGLIRRVTDRPVCYLVNTHWHGDHTHGNGVYADSFPGVKIVGTAETRDYITVNLQRYPRRATDAAGPRRLELGRLEALLRSGRDSAGRSLSADERARLGAVVAERREEQLQLSRVRVAAPDLLFEGDLRLDLGGISVRVHSWGRANSPDDLTVEVPADGILFTGDIVVYPVPYAWESHPTHWLDVLRAIERMPVRTLVPGHGPVQQGLAYTAQVRQLLQAVLDRVRPLVNQGSSVENVVSTVRLDDLRPAFLPEGDVSAPTYWEQSIGQALLDRAYWCVVGYRC